MNDDWMRGLVDVVPSEAEVPRPAPAASPGSPEDGAQAAHDAPPQVITARDAIAQWIEEEQRPDVSTVATGWPTIDLGLDRLIRPGEVVIVAARTGVGKTWGIQAIIEHALTRDPSSGAVIVQMEMPAFHFGERLAAHALDSSPRQVRRQAERYEITADRIVQQAPYLERLLIVERSVKVNQLPGVIAQAHDRNVNTTVVAVDYTGLFKSMGGSRQSRYDKVSEDAWMLKDVAKDERTVILAAVQLSRGAGDGTVEPTLEDLRDSGVIEEAADRVVMLWRDGLVDETAGAQLADGTALMAKIAKNRFGSIGYRTHLAYDHALRLREPEEPIQEDLPY